MPIQRFLNLSSLLRGMFGKKCSKCNKKVSNGYDFCPFCGNNFNSENESEDYGMLGKDDFFEDKDPLLGVRGSFMDKILSRAMKELPNMVKMMEKEMSSEINKLERENPGNLNVQFFVNGQKLSKRESKDWHERYKHTITIRSSTPPTMP